MSSLVDDLKELANGVGDVRRDLEQRIKDISNNMKDREQKFQRENEKDQKNIQEAKEKLGSLGSRTAEIEQAIGFLTGKLEVAPKIVEKEVIKEVPVEVIKIVEKQVEVPVEVIKEVTVERIVEVPVEVIREVQVIKKIVPKWAMMVATVEFAIIILLLMSRS